MKDQRFFILHMNTKWIPKDDLQVITIFIVLLNREKHT